MVKKDSEPGEQRSARPSQSVEWKPKTDLGKKVHAEEITSIDTFLNNRYKIMEAGIVDKLLPNLTVELLLVGQSKGKFGGGQRRVFRQTQKKTREGNKPRFATLAVVGNGNGIIGIGYGKSKETVPAREKAIRNAKLNLFKVRRGNGSWEDLSSQPNTIPYTVIGKCGSIKMRLIPAPRGTGLCIDRECQKILKLAGIKDIWSHTRGQTRTKINIIKALEDGLKQLNEMKLTQETREKLHIVDGAVQ